MKRLFSLFVLFSILSVNMVAQDGSSVFSMNWIEEAEKLHAGCTYARSVQGAERAVLYYSIKETGESEGVKQSKMYVNVVEVDDLAKRGPIHEMVFIDEAYSSYPTCTDVLYIRQEGDKFYCKSEDGTKEWLILDFGMKAGDTFIDGAGKCYVVKEATNYKDTKQKELHLQSEDGTEEDTWLEGIGSLQWGFLPGYVAKTLKYFHHADGPLNVSLWAGFSPDYFFEQSINDDSYKLQPFREVKDEEAENMTYEDLEAPWLNFTFVGDSLWIQGYYPLNLYHSFVAACLSGTRINITLHQVTSLDMVKGMHIAKIDVKIPGFQAGTYQVGLPGREYVTLECKGATTPIESIKPESKAHNTIYDLSGRKISNSQLSTVNCQLKKGLYIVNGKVMVK